MGDDYKTLTVDSLKDESGLKNVVIKLSNKFTTAIGIMNRDNGIREETMEYMSSGKKAIVSNLTETSYFENNPDLKFIPSFAGTYHYSTSMFFVVS